MLLIIREWKYITRLLKADIVVLENETLFDSQKFKTMGDLGKLLEDQFLSMLSYVAKNKGITFGRPKYKITPFFVQVYDEWKKGALLSKDAMKILELKPNTFYRRVKEHEMNKNSKLR